MELRRRTVSEVMRREVVTLQSKETLDLTQDLMNLARVRHLPVLDQDRLVGIVSHRDLLAASLTNALDFDKTSRRSFLHSVEVAEVMRREVVTIGPDATLADAARILVRRQIGCLPVVDSGGSLIGLVTETDLVSAAFLDGQGSESDGRTIDVSKKEGFSEWIRAELNDLRRMRDELRVRAHLGKAEMRERWTALERDFEALEQRAKRTARAAEQPLHQLEDDLRKLARDLREGYQRLRGVR
jgi:CBS domain-containing membrane protein